MKQADNSVPSSSIMEEALFLSVKARPASLSHAANLPAGVYGDGEDGDNDDYNDGKSEIPSYGSSSPCSSSSVRSPFSSDGFLSCTLHGVHGFSDKGPFGFSDGGHSCSSLSHACAYDKYSTSSCQTAGCASSSCGSILCNGGGSSMHGSDDVSLGLIDDDNECSTSPHVYADVKRVASNDQTTECASLGSHNSLCRSSEGEKSVKNPSSSGFNDSYGCSISSYHYLDEVRVVSSCCIAGQYSTDSHCGLCHTSEDETDMRKPASLRFGDDCKYSTLSHAYADDDHVASSCHGASCTSSVCYDCLCHGSAEGLGNASLRFEEGNSALNHLDQNGVVGVSMHKKDDTLFIHSDFNEKSSVGHGSSCQGGLLCCPAQPDGVSAFEPSIEGTSVRGNFIVPDMTGAKCSKRESLGSWQNGQRRGSELSQMFQLAVDNHDWQVAEDLIPLADKQRLNDWLCVAVDSFWFLCTHNVLCSATQIMEKLVKAGADGFMRAALRTSFLASCIWACQSRTRDASDMANILADRLHERLEECSGYELSSAEAVAKVKRMTEWALKCIVLHRQAEMRGYDGEVYPLTPLGAQLQLRAFKRFLELAENRLSGEDYTEAFEAACFPLSLFSSALDAGWASGIAASALQGLLGMLVEGGADNVNQCCLEAARSGSTELLRMLLQIAQRNGIEVDVDVALGYASHHCKLGTMECLVDVGNTAAFLDPLIRASDRGCMPVVQWFVEKGCQDTELCWGLTAAVSRNRVEVAEYLLKCIPLTVLSALSLDIVKAAAEHSGGCLKGVAFLFEHAFLGNLEATYEVADRISKLEDDLVSRELKLFCKREWSNEAFLLGRQAGADHYLNVQRVLCHGSSALQLKELPPQLQVAIAYLPLYKECATSCGLLLSQRLRGQLVEAASRLADGEHYTAERLIKCDKSELVALLKARLPAFFVEKY